jgi:hypothetical protein
MRGRECVQLVRAQAGGHTCANTHARMKCARCLYAQWLVPRLSLATHHRHTKTQFAILSSDLLFLVESTFTKMAESTIMHKEPRLRQTVDDLDSEYFDTASEGVGDRADKLCVNGFFLNENRIMLHFVTQKSPRS